MSALKFKLIILVILFGFVLTLRALLIDSNPAYAKQIENTPMPRRPEQLPPTPIPSSVSEVMSTSEIRIIEEVSEAKTIPVERLQVGYFEEWNLPLTGEDFSYAKVIDTATGKDYTIGLDQNGAIVDPEALRAAERAAYSATFGKLHPSLVEYLIGIKEQDMVRVSIWLDMGGRDASIPRINQSEAAGMSLEALRQHKAEGIAHAAQIHQEVEQPLLDFLPTIGGEIISAADTGPIVFAEVPVQAIKELESLPYVDSIDLLVEGGPEDGDDGDEKNKLVGGPELASARPASKANIVQARGFDGTGIVAAVIEGDSIEFANPYLVDGTCGPTSTCPTLDEHPTTVGGIMASAHSTSRGVAPGIGSNLLSGNGAGWDLSHHQAATTWALGQGAKVLNNSYFIESDGLMHNSDRWMDYIVRSYGDLEVKSAGNLGESNTNVTSPGLGYNTLTVGAVEDKNTLTWDDDAMAELSSYNEPAGREKPEVSAIGCGNWVTGVGGVPGIISTGMYDPWIYDQGCGTSYAAPVVAGGGALLLERDPGLDYWPEAQKAILIATALHNVEGNPRISEVDGAGSVDLAAADTVAANGWWRGYFVTPGMFDVNYNFDVMSIYLYAGERVRVALAYDSNPSADFTSDPLEGDLDIYLLNNTSTVVASSSGIDSWEIIEYQVLTSGQYTIRLENHAGSLSGTESTYAGIAVWPGHYVLQPYISQFRDQPSGNWNQDSGDDYRFTRGIYWNAVGVRFPNTADYDMFLFNKSVYDDPADHAWLEDSTLSGEAVEIVVVDGNHGPSGNYYNTVSRWSGTGNYSIQHATRTTDLHTGTYGPYSASSSDILRVWDIYFTAGQTKYICVSQASGSADLGVLLFDSNESQSASWYQGRSQAVASVDKWRAGSSEYMTYTSPDTDFKGLVIYNKGGSSSYNVTVSSTPIPTCESWYGGISITSDRNIVTVGRPHIDNQIMTYDGFTTGSLTAYVPMLFKDAFGGSYDSALYIQNVDPSNTANITIRFYDNSGVQTHSMTDTLSPLASKGYWLPSISSLGASWVGGVKVESNRNIVTVGRPHVGTEVTTYVGFMGGSLSGYVPMLFKDAFGGSYDSALYIQNVDPSNTANITIRLYDNNGNLSCAITDSLPQLSIKGWWLPSLSGCLP